MTLNVRLIFMPMLFYKKNMRICLIINDATTSTFRVSVLTRLCSVSYAHSNYAVMESLPIDPFFEFPPNILESVRKQYNLDQPGRIEEAVDILCDWLKKQDHLVTKNYAREYLERILINCKGSVEKTKKKLDKLCTCRMLLPRYFEEFEIRENPVFKDIKHVFLPKMTDDYNRVYLLRNWCKKFDFMLLDYYRSLLLKCEYFQSRDYCNGIIIVLDYSQVDMFEFLKVLNFAELEQSLSIATEGYAVRVKSIHIIINSKLVETFVTIVKKALSPKLAQRIQVHKKIESIYSFVPKDIMPAEYGGKEKSLQELHDRFVYEITSEPFKSYIEETRKAITNEGLRQSGGNADYLGLSGSFRKLTVD